MGKRGGGIGNLSTLTETSGTIDPFGMAFVNMMAVNNTSQIGIGTESEVGLELDRYPVRVVLADGSPAAHVCSVAIRYWAVRRADGNPLGYSRSPAVNSIIIGNLYKCVATLDDDLFAQASVAGRAQFAIVEALTPEVTALYAVCQNAVLTDEQNAEIAARVRGIIAAATAARVTAYFKVSDNAYWVASLHGASVVETNGVTGRQKIAYEFNATWRANYDRLRAAYPAVSSGLAVTCAYSIAWMFRMGLFETHEAREYVTLTVSHPVNKRFTVTAIDAPEGYVAPPFLAVGQGIDCTVVKYDKQAAVLGPALVYLSGVNHYTFNHTTAGMKVGGAMLSVLMMYGLYDSNPATQLEEAQTRMLYETLHPANKRGIANLWFRDTHVTTWGRSISAPKMQIIKLDAFLQIRDRPTAAGSHKAYLAGVVLQKICQANLVAFLPWSGELNSVIESIRSVIDRGARAHVGSSYYTGLPSVSQGSALDPYMGELAQYIQTMASRDTLALSPHLSLEVAARSSTNWVNILKKIKSEDLSAVAPEKIAEFLSASGGIYLQFDPENRDTWGVAAQAARDGAEKIGAILKL